jgi:hypothetical protein
MFSPALGRVVRSSGSLPARPAAAVLGVQQSFTRPTHQRRLSSSKASIPPDGSERPSSARQQTSPTAQKVTTRKLTGQTGRKRAPAAPALNLPHVPPTDHLQIPGKQQLEIQRKGATCASSSRAYLWQVLRDALHRGQTSTTCILASVEDLGGICSLRTSTATLWEAILLRLSISIV